MCFDYTASFSQSVMLQQGCFKHPSHNSAESVEGRVIGVAVAQTTTNEDLSVNARLLVAARDADAAGLERALASGASVNSRNRLGESALVILLKNNHVDIAQKILAAGADVNLAAVNGTTPLMAAAFNGQTAMVKQLLPAKA